MAMPIGKLFYFVPQTMSLANNLENTRLTTGNTTVSNELEEIPETFVVIDPQFDIEDRPVCI
jgi:hypothetical protein